MNNTPITSMEQIANKIISTDKKKADPYYMAPITPMTNSPDSPLPITMNNKRLSTPSSPTLAKDEHKRLSNISTNMRLVNTPCSPIRESPTTESPFSPITNIPPDILRSNNGSFEEKEKLMDSSSGSSSPVSDIDDVGDEASFYHDFPRDLSDTSSSSSESEPEPEPKQRHIKQPIHEKHGQNKKKEEEKYGNMSMSGRPILSYNQDKHRMSIDFNTINVNTIDINKILYNNNNHGMQKGINNFAIKKLMLHKKPVVEIRRNKSKHKRHDTCPMSNQPQNPTKMKLDRRAVSNHVTTGIMTRGVITRGIKTTRRGITRKRKSINNHNNNNSNNKCIV